MTFRVEALQFYKYVLYSLTRGTITAGRSFYRTAAQQLCWFFAYRYTNADLAICQYLRLHMKIICWRFHIKTPFTFYFNLYTIILVSFPSGGWFGEVINNQVNYQGCKYDVCFLHCHTFIVIYFMNHKGFC